MIVLIHVINICETLPFHVLKILRCFFSCFFSGGSIKHLRVRFGVFFGFFCSFFLGGGVGLEGYGHPTPQIPRSHCLRVWHKRDASNDNTCACLKLFAASQLRCHHFTLEFLLHPLNNLIAHIKVYWWTEYYLVG